MCSSDLTNWKFIEVKDHAPNIEASIFSNPTEEVLNIRSTVFEEVTYTLYDAQGKLILQDNLFADLTQIRVVRQATGSYSLTLNIQNKNKKKLNRKVI